METTRVEGALYERQTALESALGRPLNVPTRAVVVGCGGTGSWVAIFLAMSGCPSLELYDMDKLETSNLNRLPFESGAVGSFKTEVLRNFIRKIRPDCSVSCYQEKITDENVAILDEASVIFCCTDNVKSQQLLNKWCRQNNIQYQRCGYDGITLNVSRAFPFTFSDEETNGYTITPSWSIPAATAASLAVFSVMAGEVNFTEDMRMLAMGNSSMVTDFVMEAVKDCLTDTCMVQAEAKVMANKKLGHCDDCHRGDCDNCNRGDCDNCEYYSPDSVSDLIREGNWDDDIHDCLARGRYDEEIRARLLDAEPEHSVTNTTIIHAFASFDCQEMVNTLPTTIFQQQKWDALKQAMELLKPKFQAAGVNVQ